MKPIETQMALEDISPEYKEFVQKFKPKKTTDDCYTPENVYGAVRDWACEEYGLDPERVARPFWPGGDYKRFPYKDGDVVIDNPPFSIMTQIVDFYLAHEIPFFLFAPYLTNFSAGKMDVCHVITATSITYQNGAEVPTSFVTNLEPSVARSAPALSEAVKAENDRNLKELRKKLPKYAYPDEVLTASDLGYMSQHGVDYKVSKKDAFFVRGLDSQRAAGKSIFGAGFLLSERAAAERAAAERAAAERAAAERAAAERVRAKVWQLSSRERALIRGLGNDDEAP